ncbi:hypothetical protein ACTFIR_002492 [Dictyostelium discoideum]
MIPKKQKGFNGEPRSHQETDRNQSPLKQRNNNNNYKPQSPQPQPQPQQKQQPQQPQSQPQHPQSQQPQPQQPQPQQPQSQSQPQQKQPQQQQQPQQYFQPRQTQNAWGKQNNSIPLQEQFQEVKPITQPLTPETETKTTTTTTTTTTNTTNTTNTNQLVTRILRRDMVKDSDIENVAIVTEKVRNVQGKPISLISNFFPIVISDRKSLEYRIDFDPPQVTFDKRQFYFYDGDSILYSPITININSQSIDGVQIFIRKVKEVNHRDKSSANSQFFNIITKNNMRKMGFSLIGRNYYSPINKFKVQDYLLEVWKGFSTSVVSTESGTMLLADTSSKVVRSETVLDRIKYHRYDKDRCFDEIVNSIVLTRYNNKTYRISNISWSSGVNDKMDGTTTFLQYYQRNYPNHKITDYRQPLLKSEVKFRGIKQTIFLIPELTFLTGLSDHMRKNFNLMSQLAKHSNFDPSQRYQTLSNFVSDINNNEKVSKSLEPWGITYQPALKVDGFVLSAPKNLPNDNKRQLNNIKWAFVVDRDEYRTRDCQNGLDNFINETGMSQPTICHTDARDRKPIQYSNIMENAIKTHGIQFFLMLIPQNQSEIYKEIKRKSLVHFKVLTQCIFPRTFYKGRSVTNKLKQQVIAKLGYAPWGLNQQIFNGVIPKKTMIIGIDVGHNSDMRGHSVVGFVATIDDKFQKYFSRSFVQKRPGKEIIDSLEEATKEAMSKYFSFNNCLPELVIVYRDGVGDGMLDLVNRSEIAAMKKGFAETPSSWGIKPKLMYVIVKKNTNARLFTANPIGNPPAGTLVDSKITHPNWYDFFLVSQVTFNGSVNPTHYHVLLDEQRIPADLFQLFTFQMCHLYFNFEKSVSVPATCQFAHKMAFLIGRTVFADAAPQLSDKLFFL